MSDDRSCTTVCSIDSDACYDLPNGLSEVRLELMKRLKIQGKAMGQEISQLIEDTLCMNHEKENHMF